LEAFPVISADTRSAKARKASVISSILSETFFILSIDTRKNPDLSVPFATSSTPTPPKGASKSSKNAARLPTPSEMDEMSGNALLRGLKELQKELKDRR
jgi:hypothetical protein